MFQGHVIVRKRCENDFSKPCRRNPWAGGSRGTNTHREGLSKMSRKTNENFNLTRRQTLAGGVAAIATPFIARSALADQELRILTWEG